MKFQLKKIYSLIILLACFTTTMLAQDVNITVNATLNKRKI